MSADDSEEGMPNMVPFLTVMMCLYVLGLIGNGLIIVATFRSDTNLKSKSNRLIGILAIYDFVSSAGSVGVFALSFVGSLSVRDCFYYLSPYLFSLNAGALMIAMLGVDRLLAMWSPLKYDKYNRSYITFMSLPPIVYSLSCLAFAFMEMPPANVTVNQCQPPEAFPGVSMDYWILTNLIICLLVIVVYGTAYRKASKMGFGGAANSRSEKLKQRTLQSLMIIMGVYAASWCSTIITLLIISSIDISPTNFVYSITIVGMGSDINVSCNAYVYMARSAEYRREFLRLFGVKPQGNLVTTVTPKM